MKKPIRILHFADERKDAKLVEKHIKTADLTVTINVVKSREDFINEIRNCSYDVILSDFYLKEIDGISVLRLAKKESPTTPFIFISGTAGEEAAISGLLAGASDYILKSDLSRLISSIKRVVADSNPDNTSKLNDSESSWAMNKQDIHMNFLESLARVNDLLQKGDGLRIVMQSVLAEVLGVLDCDIAFLIYPCDPAAFVWKMPVYISKQTPEMLIDPDKDYPMSDDVAKLMKQLLEVSGSIKYEADTTSTVYSAIAQNNTIKSGLFKALRPKVDKPWHFGIIQTGDTRIWSSEEQKFFEEIGSRLTDAMTNIFVLRESTENERRLLEAQRLGRIGSWEWDARTDKISWSKEYYEIYGLDPSCEPPGYEEHLKAYTVESAERLNDAVKINMQTGKTYELDLELATAHGKCRWVTARSETIYDGNRKIIGLRGTAQDITSRKSAEEALFESQQVFRTLVENSPDIIARYDRNCQRTYVNPVYLKTAKLPESDLLSTAPINYSPLPHESAVILQDLLRRVLQTGKPDVVDVIWPKEDNIEHWYNISAFPEFNKDGEVVSAMTISRDITEQKQHEKLLGRLNRELRAISNCNQVLLHAEDEEQLISQVCRIICDEAGYRLAWVGYAQYDEKKSIRIVAKAGYDAGYADEANFSWSADDEKGQGPAGNAIRSGEIRYVQNIAFEPSMKIWHAMAEINGYKSTISLPLKDDAGNAFGVLAIYSEEVNSLNPDEIRLLQELADDLAFGITNLRARVERIEAEKALAVSMKKIEESEAKYRLIAENTADSIAVFDMNLNYTYVSPSTKKMLGYSPEEMIELGLKKILPPPFLKIINQIYLEEMELEKRGNADPNRSRSVISQQVRKDGTLLWVEAVVSFIRDEKGLPVRILSVSRDITHRRNSELELLKLSRTIVQSPVSVVITDTQGNIEFVNPKFTEVTGYTSEEVLGKNPRILKSGEMPAEGYHKLWNTITAGKIWEGEFHNKKKNGELFWEKCLLTPIIDTNGAITNFVAIKEDITEKKKMLDDLVEAKNAAEKSNKLKDAFIANISHEIRTPLNGLLGMTSIIKDEFIGKYPTEVSRYFDAIDISSQRIIRTVDMILNYSRIQVNDFVLNPKPTDIFKICTQVFSKFQISANVRGISFQLENRTQNPVVNTDEYAIIQIFTNLIDNAIKYTNAGEVRVTVLETPEGKISVLVQDTGIGIAKEYLQHIFEPYRQEQFGYGRAYEGVGLGMALVKRIVDLIHADISIESEKGKGTSITIVLGDSAHSPQSVDNLFPAESARTNVPQRWTILIAEDDYINQKTISKFISDNYHVIIADSFETLEQLLLIHKVDLIIMDISLKGSKNGLEITRALRASDKYSSIKIIAATAHAFDTDRQNAKNAGCDDFIAKPFTKAQLLSRIEKLLESTR